MKIYDENKNYVGEIERPEPIEQDGKWWEFTEFRTPKKGEFFKSESTKNTIFLDEYGIDICRWIASEIPRATDDQLRAIGMKERDGRPVLGKKGDVIWFNGKPVRIMCGDHTKDGVKLNDIYRFVLVPDVQEEKHYSCYGCKKAMNDCEWVSCLGDSNSLERKNYTARQPPQPAEPRFTNEQVQQIDQWINSIANDHPNNAEFIAHLHYLKGLLYNLSFGILAFTERRRECP